MSKETKTLSFQVKDLGTVTDATTGQEYGQIEAYGAIFNNVDDDKDRIVTGAFKRTLKDSKERAIARATKYLAPMLWQHNVAEIIGGWSALEEDTLGLKARGDINLATQRGREYYALAKAGMSSSFSIIYDIPTGGAHYDKSGVRELTELRLFSIDPVTFAANDATFLVGVKASDSSAGGGTMTVCGNVKGTIGPRDESWDGGKAEGQIWAAAYNDDTSTVEKAKAKKYFMVCSGDGTKKGDYSYPFWYVGSSPHICVGAVKAIAGAIQGSRGASAPEGLKPKVEGLYRRINGKYPDDPQLTPPWKDDGEKGAHVPTDKAATPRQQKTFTEHYTEQQCKDLLRDWQDVVLCAFTSAVYDAFTIGDEPESDVNAAIDELKSAVTDWVAEAVKYELSDYLDAQSDTYDGGAQTRMRNGTTSSYGGYNYFARQTPMHSKAMEAGDATTGGFTTEHVEKLRNASAKAKEAVVNHIGTLYAASEDIKALLPAPATTPVAIAAKAGRAFSAANEQALNDHVDVLNGAAKSLKKSMDRHLGTVSNVADDLATVLQGSEAAYGTDPGKPSDGNQEGKNGSIANRTSSLLRTRAPHPPSSRIEDAVSEEDVSRALAELKKLRIPA